MVGPPDQLQKRDNMTKERKKLDPVNKSRLHEGIVRQIEKKIVKGEFAVGDKLPPEREIARSLQVNRSTVREALKKLELLGLVEIRHGDGIYVQDYLRSGNLELFREIIYMDDVVNYDVLKSILDMRRIMVPEMSFLAAENRTPEELREMGEVALMAEGSEPILERDLRVHHIIARASRNMVYVFILNFFNQIFRDYGYLYFSNPANVRRSAKFHRDMYEAMKKKSGERARKVMRDVLIYTEKQIYEYYDKTFRAPEGKGARNEALY